MNAIDFYSSISDDERRRRLYEGDIIVLKPSASSLALCNFAYDMMKEAFDGADPERVQYEREVTDYADVLSRLKPAFIHHPRCKELIKGILREAGADGEKTYFDVPRLRTSTSDGYLTSGIAYAFHPHRDTWYSAPMCQINWWMPVCDVVAENTLAFHLGYWDRPVKNSSSGYNYYEWNRKSRREAARHVKKDTRTQPIPLEELNLSDQLALVCPRGSILLFSGAHLHSSVPNTSGRTRLSIDFRTVHYDDVAGRIGAPNIDSACTGTTMRDYLCASDLTRLPEKIVAEYDQQPPASDAELVFRG